MSEISFSISNPSPYWRSDYVQLSMKALKIARGMTLRLYRILGEGEKNEIPFQVDYLLGLANSEGDTLSFFCDNIPASGSDDYKLASAEYLIETSEIEQEDTVTPTAKHESLHIGHYYKERKPNEPDDAYSKTWEANRPQKGVQLKNDALEVYFMLSQEPRSPDGLSYAGAATSISLYGEEMLSPFLFSDNPNKRWGQVRQLVFFPLPWQNKWFHREDCLNLSYDLVWANVGPTRAVITLRSPAMKIPYDCNPFIGEKLDIECYLYRVLSVYPGGRPNYYPEGCPYYLENIFVMTQLHGNLLSFRPYYTSEVYPKSEMVQTDRRRFEHIPDYFSIWKHNGSLRHWGYGFASDAHVRGLEINDTEISWRFSLTRSCQCVHYFSYEFTPKLPPSFIIPSFDPFHTIGHKGWYEKIFKPLAPVNRSLMFPEPLVED